MKLPTPFLTHSGIEISSFAHVNVFVPIYLHYAFSANDGKDHGKKCDIFLDEKM